MALASFSPSIPVCGERVVAVQRQQGPAACVLANHAKLLLSRILASYIAPGDEITFPIPAPDAVGPEILVTKNAASGSSRYIYQAPIGYVSQPNTTVVDRRETELLPAFDSGMSWRGIDDVFASGTNAAGAQCRATRAIAMR